jgi:branched-chain amino acid transport system substrate-binding protein
MYLKKSLHVVIAVYLASFGLSASATNVKIGFITTLTGPGGVIGKHMQDAAELALDHLNRKVGGLETEIIYGDDQQKPETGRQVADEMIKRNRVDFIAGVIWSNVMLAVQPAVVRSETFLISANAGPSALAGAECSPFFFSASLQNDQPSEAAGKVLQDQKIDDVFIIVPNYAAGKDNVAGFKRYYKGKVAGEVYFQVGQQDFAAELTQIRKANPKAVFVFAPGGMGIQFVKQFEQAGLKGKIPLYSVYSQDEVTLPAQREAALGNSEARNWVSDLKNDANIRFVADFQKKYKYTPSWYAAQTYDSIMLIDSAVRGVKGDLSNKKATATELRKANFKSVRGNFKFNTNNFPIQDFYMVEIVKINNDFVPATKQRIFTNHSDSYASQCKMN